MHLVEPAQQRHHDGGQAVQQAARGGAGAAVLHHRAAPREEQLVGHALATPERERERGAVMQVSVGSLNSTGFPVAAPREEGVHAPNHADAEVDVHVTGAFLRAQ